MHFWLIRIVSVQPGGKSSLTKDKQLFKFQVFSLFVLICQELHYENMSTCMQYTAIFTAVKMEKKISCKEKILILIFASNIDCGYTLEPPH